MLFINHLFIKEKIMYWTIETTGGCFTGSKLKKTINDMIEYYGLNEESPDQIDFFVGHDKKDRIKIIYKTGVSKAQQLLDEGVSEWKKRAEEESRHQEDLRSDYYASAV
jgi:hypothetical protein